MQLFALSTVMAQTLQKFSVSSFDENPFDTSARTSPYELRDGNGERFAIVKVKSTLEDDDLRAYSYDFGLCEHRVKQVDGEVWLYVQRNAMHVTIKRSGYNTVKYELNTTVQPGKVYGLVLNPVPVVIKKRMVQFEITPASSRAQISYIADGKKGNYEVFGEGLIDEDGMAADKLELGTYTYKIISKNYHPSEGRIILTDADTTHIERVTLRPNYGNVTLTSQAGADIYIDGERKGAGSWKGALKAGTYNVECRLASHKNSTDVITIKDGEEKTFELKAPIPITGTLSLFSKPLGATIVIDGKEYGKTAADIPGLLIGEHTVSLSKAGYETAVFTVNILENKTSDYEKTLVKGGKKDEEPQPENKPVNVPKPQEVKKDNDKAKAKKPAVDNAKTAKGFRYHKKFSAYAEITSGYTGVDFVDIGANIGCYLTYVNLEGYFSYGFSSATVYGYSDGNPYTMSPMNFGGRIGFGLPIGKNLALTPQFGFGALCVTGNQVAATAMNITGGLRCEYHIAKGVGISFTPEYTCFLNKSNAMNILSSVSPTVSNWLGAGVNLRLGVHFNF